MNLIQALSLMFFSITPGKILLACCSADVLLAFATLETRTPGRVEFRKDFWDCYLEQGKKWPIADRHVTSTIPETIAVRVSVPVPFLFLKWRIARRAKRTFLYETKKQTSLNDDRFVEFLNNRQCQKVITNKPFHGFSQVLIKTR